MKLIEVDFQEIAKICKMFFPESHCESNVSDSFVKILANQKLIGSIKYDVPTATLIFRKSLSPGQDHNIPMRKLFSVVKEEHTSSWWARVFRNSTKPKGIVKM